MNKQLFSIFLAVVTVAAVMLAFSSCADPDLVGTGAAQTTEVTQTDAPVSGDTTETETNAVSESVEESQSETQTEASGEVDSVSLNMDLFEEYGMTYAELKEKHGKLVDFQSFDGGSWYLFENSDTYYWFGAGITANSYITDPETNVKYIPVGSEETICRGIRNISPESLVNESFELLSIETISNVEGLNHVKTTTDGIVTPRAYATIFTYDGWNNDKVELTIYHEDEKMIDLTSEARVLIHPKDIRAETAQ